MNAPDLNARPPRSPRVRLGGYAMFPRVLDKARSTLAGTPGLYKYGNPMDQQLFAFTGIGQETLLEQVKTGAGDWALLQWLQAEGKPHRLPHEIHAWSDWLETVTIGDADDMTWFVGEVRRLNSARTDVQTIMDYLDVDDHVSFGGLA